jgi:Na+/proline symporter
MSPLYVLMILLAYFSVLILIAFITSKGSTTDTFFTANKQSPWYLVAFGMIGASLSGVTFVSVPGDVLTNQFAYFQMVLGYILGYWFIGAVLMPIYYRLNLVSIYGYLEHRLGFWAYKTGAFFFLLSRTVGSAFRLFLAVMILHIGLFKPWGIPFEVSAIVSIALIWVYTFQGGIKTIVWTDTMQTVFLILGAFLSVYFIQQELHLSLSGLTQAVYESPYSKIFFWEDWKSPLFFPKQFISGACVAIVMTGLDQDLMQKNLTCKNIKEAQKNMFWFTLVMVVVVFLFLVLGAMLYMYADMKGIDLPNKLGVISKDKVYPFLAFNHFGILAGTAFLLGITAATYASSDSALTALTTSFCIDFLNISKVKEEKQKQKIVRWVHLGFSGILVVFILLFRWVSETFPNTNVIGNLFIAAGYTYGPLLGLFAFGLFTKRKVNNTPLIPVICILGAIFTYFIYTYSKELLGGYAFASEHLIINGLFTFIGLMLISKK